LDHADPSLIEAVEECNSGFEGEILAAVFNGDMFAFDTPHGILVLNEYRDELVAVTFKGKDARIGLIVLKQAALDNGYRVVRIHGETPALGRLYNIGPPCEYIWRVPVKGKDNG
jgi:hypothetical protein